MEKMRDPDHPLVVKSGLEDELSGDESRVGNRLKP